MKLDKDYKNEVDQNFKKGAYITKKILIWTIIIILTLSIIFGGIYFVNKMIKTNADRVVFKQSITYNEGMLDDLAKYQLEIIQAEDEVEKLAIAQLVVERFANFDESKIESEYLKKFLQDCRNMNLGGY